MELTSLRYFVTVAEELHFRKAARKLHMTQGPLSTAIKKLEEELDTPLFERSSRWVKLTPAGEYFLEEAQGILLRAFQAKQNLARFVSEEGKRLAIGYNEPVLNTILPSLLSFCNREMPQIELELHELEASEQIRSLQNNTLDVGFIRPYGFDLGTLCSSLVHREKYCFVLPEGHTLAVHKQITLEMLSKQDIILFARDVNPPLFDLLCAKLTPSNGAAPRFKQSARTKRSMLAMVRAGFGAALLPESTLHNDSGTDLVIAEAAFDLPSIDIMAVWNPEKSSPALQKILQYSCRKGENP